MKALDLLNRLSRPDILIGIDQGAYSLKIAIARRTPQGLELQNFLIENLLGIEEEKRNAFSRDKLLSLLRDKNISKAGVFFVAHNNDAHFSKRLTLPAVSAREIKQVLSWETKDSLPFPAAQAVFDFQIIEEKQNPQGGKSLDLIAMAVDRKTIAEAVAFLEGTELSLENVTIVPACLINIVNCLQSPNFQTEEPIAFLELGYRHSNLCIFKGKKLIFTRHLLIGSNDITNSMMAEVSTDTGVVNLSHEQAEKIKLEIGIPQKSGKIKVGGQTLELSRLSSMILPTLEKISKEINKSFIYAIAKLEIPEPKEMFLIGGGALLKNIDKFFKDQLKIDAKVFTSEKDDPFCASISSDQRQDIPQIIPVIGAVVGQEDEINLLPFEFKKRKLVAGERIVVRMAIFAAFAFLLLWFTLVSYRQIIYKKKYKYMRRQQDVMFQLRKSKNEIEKTQAVLSAIKGNRINALTIFQELSLRTPKDILIDKLGYSYFDEEVEIGGVILSSELMAPVILSEYIKTIENSPIFENANLISSTQRSDEETSLLEFTIRCTLEEPL